MADNPKSANAAAGNSAPSPFSAPQINLPKGGGAIRGIGEKFSANALTGTGALTIPIAVSPGRSGFDPQLSLEYDSGSANGVFGLGWSLTIPSITRKTEKGLPQYHDLEESDVFILSGAEDLVPVLCRGDDDHWADDEFDREGYRVKRYRPRVEGLFARIERWTRIKDGDTHWRSFSKDDVLTLYGTTREARICDPANEDHTFSWLISSSFDGKGNAILYEYVPENDCGVDLGLANERNRTRTANRYLKRVLYGNRKPLFRSGTQVEDAGWMFELVLDYGDDKYETLPSDDEGNIFAEISEGSPHRLWPVRRDPFSTYRSGFEVRTYRLCQRLLMFHNFSDELERPRYLVRSTELEYEQKGIGSFLTRAMQSGYVHERGDRYLKKSMPPLDLSYSPSPLEDESFDRYAGLNIAEAQNLPEGIDGSEYRWLDLDGVGISGVLTEQGTGWYFKKNLGQGIFGATELVSRKPSLGELSSGQQQLLDIAGDGNLDLVSFENGHPGFYERTTLRAEWEPFRSFRSIPVVDWDDPNLRFVDVTGDGIADILITEDIAFRWHPSHLQEGFGEEHRIPSAQCEEEGPRIVFHDGTQSIYLADMSGDGLSDIVRIRNGEICYWPNLGYGRFGAKVTMDHSPWFDLPDKFDQKRIRLADTDGSGTSDILYLGDKSLDVYLNEAGNGWSSRRVLESVPTGDLKAISVTDFLGRGTACVVWSSPLPSDTPRPLRYLDLMRGRKPHLLIRISNNLGAETTIEYGSSTEFYLADEAAGHPWITRLPFPVHVVKKTETYDAISRNRFITRRTYHHGYYDGIEREFRGFGRVEQLDTEELGALAAGKRLPAVSNENGSFNLPPMLTKTWFHTGVFAGGDRVSRHVAHEYYREPLESGEMRLDDTILPSYLTTEESREACRSLKGSVLRQEVYALDGAEESARPYTASENNFTIRPLQPRKWNRHAVFFTHARESVTFNYERKLYRIEGMDRADPRVSHALTLEVDEYGDILKAVNVAYGRRFAGDSHLPGGDAQCEEDRRKQQQLLLTLTENEYTNAVREREAYRNPLTSETRTYELYNVNPQAKRFGATNLFRFEEMRLRVAEASDGRHDLPYEDMNPERTFRGHPCRRLFRRSRTLYRSDDLDRFLPLGRVESLALPGQAYTLALTPGVIRDIYRRQMPDQPSESLLRDPRSVLEEGGYVDLDGDNHWWIPSGRIFYSPEGENSGTELAHARRHFFTSRRYRDPFGNITHVFYDPHDLLLTATRDAAGNTTSALTDYRVLAPRLLTDPNRIRTAACFDALGLLTGTAIMGKEGDGEGDSLDGFTANLSERELLAHIRHPLRDPWEVLRGATTRFVYDLFAFTRTKNDPQPQPSVSYTMARETHLSDLPSGHHTRIQHAFSYSDGFGHIVQTKSQAAPGPLEPSGPEVNPRWIGSGWTIFNNKGKPVRQYEPFFSETHDFQFANVVGVSPTLFYDPVGRVIATLRPEHTYEKVVFDPWQQTTWDVNDTVLERDPADDPAVGGFFRRLDPDDYLPTWYEQRRNGALGEKAKEAAEKATVHARTPKTVNLDALGRPFLTVDLNRFKHEDELTEQHIESRLELDIEGQELFVTDALGRHVISYAYDLVGNRIYQSSVDAGQRWAVLEIGKKPLRAWDGRGFEFRYRYDMLRRQTDYFVRGEHSAEKLAEKLIYGEGQHNDLARNLRGKVFQNRDEAGLATYDSYDFKGNLLRNSRRLLRDYHDDVDWNRSPELEERVFASSTSYDALNRPVTQTAPDGSVVHLRYNEASLLDEVRAQLRGAVAEPFVKHITYNSRSQREHIAFGNGARTHYTYDPLTFRLVHLKTTREKYRDSALQDLHYTYDAIGNISFITDHAQGKVYFDNQVVSSNNEYVYDAIYRLIEANGREQIGLLARPELDWNDEPRMNKPLPSDGQAMRRYKEDYRYDLVGNILAVIHHAHDGSWRRHYEYPESSNRLACTRVGEHKEHYSYDANGNMVHMPHLPVMSWDFKNQLRLTKDQVARQGEGRRTFYVYDASGMRVRKVTERPDGSKAHERIYLGGYEIYRKYHRTQVTLERETLHVMDDKRCIALVETKTIDEKARPEHLPHVLVRYQFTNHLDSSCLELDGEAEIISYEEYYPYGSTSYEAVRREVEASPKRYRFTGKERDEETGLYYHGARYYIPWLGRWTAADPAGLVDGPNLYVYTRGNPIGAVDPTGRQSDEELDAGAGSNTDQGDAGTTDQGDAGTTVQNSDATITTQSTEPGDSLPGGAGVSQEQAQAGQTTKEYVPGQADAELEQIKEKTRKDVAALKKGGEELGQGAAAGFVNSAVGMVQAPTENAIKTAEVVAKHPWLGTLALSNPLGQVALSAVVTFSQGESSAYTSTHSAFQGLKLEVPDTPLGELGALAGEAELLALTLPLGGEGGGGGAAVEIGESALPRMSNAAILQHHTANVYAELMVNAAENPGLYEAYMEANPFARRDFGNLMQSRVGQSVTSTPTPTGILPITQRPGVSVPDFLYEGGTGRPFAELTTMNPKTIQAHLARWYGPHSDLILYKSLPSTIEPQALRLQAWLASRGL